MGAGAGVLSAAHFGLREVWGLPRLRLPPTPARSGFSNLHTHTHTRTHVQTHTHVHTHVHTYTHAHMYTHTYTQTHTHARAHMCTHACTHTYTHVHTYIETHARTCTHTQTHAHMRAHMHTYVHTDTRACAHMHTDMHAHTCTQICTRTHTYDLLRGFSLGLWAPSSLGHISAASPGFRAQEHSPLPGLCQCCCPSGFPSSLLLPPLAGLCYPACRTLTPPTFPHGCLGQVPDRTPGMVLEAGSPRSGCQWARVSRGLSRGCVDGTSSMSSCVH